MNVLHITLSLHHGGRREAILDLMQGLSLLGVENHLCCLDELGPPVESNRGLIKGVLELGRSRLLDIRTIRQLRGYCKQHQIDLMHSHDAASAVTCAMAMPLPHTPLLMSFHRTRNIESARPRDRLRNAIVGLRMGAVVTASEERRQHYVRQNMIRAGKVLRIPLGVDAQRFVPDPGRRLAIRRSLGLPADGLLLGVVGHFGPEKGVDIAIDAFQRMCREVPQLKTSLVILGTGSTEQQAFVKDCVDPAFADRIHFAGFQAHTEHWFPAFDLLLHGARREAFGLVLIEAMACGVPVVAPATGGMCDIIVDGECGYLAPVGDVDALSHRASQLLTAPEQRHKMSQLARKRVLDEYTIATCARRFHQLYQKLCQ